MPFFVEVERKFREDAECEQEAKRQAVIEELHAFKRPISKEEFEEHARRYEAEREKLLAAKAKEREQRLQEHQDLYDPGRFRTKTYEEVALEDLQRREAQETKEEMKKLLKEKQDNYARYVREMHLPQRSKAKEQELQELVAALKHPVRRAVKHPPGQELADASSVQRARSLSRGHNLSMSQNGDEFGRQRPSSRSASAHRRQLGSLRKQPGLPPLPQREPPKTDYLKERRLRRAQQAALEGPARLK